MSEKRKRVNFSFLCANRTKRNKSQIESHTDDDHGLGRAQKTASNEHNCNFHVRNITPSMWIAWKTANYVVSYMIFQAHFLLSRVSDRKSFFCLEWATGSLKRRRSVQQTLAYNDIFVLLGRHFPGMLPTTFRHVHSLSQRKEKTENWLPQ